MKIDHKGFSPVTPLRVKSYPFTPLKPTPSSSEKEKTISSSSDFFHSRPCKKVSDGHSPYLKQKNVQKIEKDPIKAVIIKQHDHADVLIEAIKSFRSLCSQQTQESLDNVLIDLYKLASLNKNKQCNLANCLMHKGKMTEAKSLLETAKPSVAERELADSYIKSFDLATKMLSELESGPVLKPPDDGIKMETQGSFTSVVKVNSSSPVSSRCVRSLDHSDSQVPSSATTVQQTCIRRCLDNSHHRVSPVSGQLQNHGFRGKWRADDSHLRISPSNGIDSDFGNWIPFGSSKSGKSWTDVIEEEEEEEECLSRFRDYSSNTVDSVSEWSRKGSNYMSQETPTQLLVDKWYGENEAVFRSDNLSSEAPYHQLSSANHIVDNLHKEFEVFDINREFRKSAARGSLCFDRKQEPESSVQQKYLYSTNRHECASNPTPLRNDRRLQVFKEITLQEDSAEKDMAAVMKQLSRAEEAIEAFESVRRLCSLQAQESLDSVLIDLYKRAGRIGEHIDLLQNHAVSERGSVHSGLRGLANILNPQFTRD
ncbi:hypothetical protein MKX03_018294 [Papaver bracteatum]|nr:hypothetical protein MKX03_018294 [Papaver bracteatum]